MLLNNALRVFNHGQAKTTSQSAALIGIGTTNQYRNHKRRNRKIVPQS